MQRKLYRVTERHNRYKLRKTGGEKEKVRKEGWEGERRKTDREQKRGGGWLASGMSSSSA